MSIVSKHLSTPQILKAGGAAILATVIVNVLTRLVLGVVLPLDASFFPFTFGPIIIFSALFTLVGVGVLALVNRFASDTLKVYNIVALVAMLVSCIPNVMAAVNPATAPMGGVGSDYLILIVFHVTGALGFLGALNFVARK